MAVARRYWVGHLRRCVDIRAIETIKNLLMVSIPSVRIVATFVAIALFASGCASSLVTNPPRSATEQLLLSSAADRAMASVDLDMFAGRSVYVDFSYFDSYDSKYAEGEIRDALFRAGALLVSTETNADIIVEARSGALAIDNDTVLFGIPNMSVPIPLSVPIEIPEIALYKTQTQHSYGKFALLAYGNRSRAHIYSSGPLDGKAYHDYHKILFVSWVATDIPEKAKNKSKAEKYKIWSPRYDLQNMPTPAAVPAPPSAKPPPPGQ